MLKILTSSASGLLIFLIIHFLYFFIKNPVEKVFAIFIIWLFVMPFVVIIYFFMPEDVYFFKKINVKYRKTVKLVFKLFISFIIYALLFIGYLEFYFTADRSITFRILMIAESENISFDRYDILNKYDTESIILRRIDDLTYGGYLEKTGDNNDKYKLTNKGILILNIYKNAIHFLNLAPSGHLKNEV